MDTHLGLTHLLPGTIATLELLATARYLLAVLRGDTRLCRTTWLIWTPLAWLTVASSAEAGASATLAKLIASAISVTVIAAVALARGTGGRAPSDLACFVLTACGLAAWSTTNDPALGLLVFLSADLVGAVPTLRQAWREPQCEAVDPWLLGALGAALNLLLIDGAAWVPSWRGFAICGYSLYLAALNGAMVALIFRVRLAAMPRSGHVAAA